MSDGLVTLSYTAAAAYGAHMLFSSQRNAVDVNISSQHRLWGSVEHTGVHIAYYSCLKYCVQIYSTVADTPNCSALHVTRPSTSVRYPDQTRK